MSDQFFVDRDGKRFGPFSALKLKELASSGQIYLTDSVWKQGMERPILASRVKNLFPAPPPPLPPADIPPPIPPVVEETQPVPAAEPQTVQPIPVPPATPARSLHPEPARKRRATAQKGAVLISQDGATVYYRKKCVQCGHEDTSRSCMPIIPGLNRSHFFCPRCRKSREVVIQGLVM